jgi:hypothetical protein
MTSDTDLQCAICGEAADDPRLVTECMSCSRTFHLNPFNDGEHRDCGDALIGPTQGVEFWCEPCLTRLNEEMSAHPPDPRGVVDNLAIPPEILQQRREQQAAEQPAAGPPPNAPPPRRARTRPAKRYRRVDS